MYDSDDTFWFKLGLFTLVCGIGIGVSAGLLIGYFIFGGAS